MTQHQPAAPLPDLTTVRVRQRSNDSRFLTGSWLVVVLVGVALLKPWGAASPAPTRPAVAVTPTTAPLTSTPTDDLTPAGLAADICLGAGGWQVATLETWQAQDVRVWRAIEPVSHATGPADPAIPSVPIVALELAALGWCAPAYGPDRPAGPAIVKAWYVRDAMVTELRVRQVRPAEGETQLGALYVPLTACPEQTDCARPLDAPFPGPWLTGLVVFRYFDVGLGRVGWFAAALEISSPPEVGLEEDAGGPPGYPSEVMNTRELMNVSLGHTSLVAAAGDGPGG